MKKHLTQLIAVLIVITSACFYDQKSHAEGEAQEFLRLGFPGQWRAVQCMNRDTDQNGYTSCTVFMNNNTTMAMECANVQAWDDCRPANNGCRLQRGQFSNMPNQGQ